ncbi:hypothetical protein ODZ84_10625 [Chryseobacterium fluminis]|uniref:hypothetical protein n=1 Tax=Chryseobacterium fluminis TaxID=2983606 RepID=UPI00224CB981|nr:hypothetical protein [Chryseobacterium sp. MMS21-Ot14]UZT99982.1 hypothetical protein ODZ84_10625 [Chryseobacterium sp. MMS21-Ot14]
MLGKIEPDLQQNLFKTRLTELINMEHPLVKLADELYWDKMEKWHYGGSGRKAFI